MAALNRAVALAEVNHIAVLVGENLKFDVMGPLDIFLEKHFAIAECGKGLAAEVQPSADLAPITGSKPIPRSEVTKKVWDYIKAHGLQDQTNRRMINADDNLKKIFNGKKQVSMFEMTALVNKHLS